MAYLIFPALQSGHQMGSGSGGIIKSFLLNMGLILLFCGSGTSFDMY
jgi:hypothetical protein